MYKLSFKKPNLKFITLLAVMTFGFACQRSFGQTQPLDNGLIFKNWTLLGESSKHIDVSYCVIKCENVNQVHLKIFNESVNDQHIRFQVEIINTETGERFSKELDVSVVKLQVVKGECSGNSIVANLKIDLPAAYNPMRVYPVITFKP